MMKPQFQKAVVRCLVIAVLVLFSRRASCIAPLGTQPAPSNILVNFQAGHGGWGSEIDIPQSNSYDGTSEIKVKDSYHSLDAHIQVLKSDAGHARVEITLKETGWSWGSGKVVADHANYSQIADLTKGKPFTAVPFNGITLSLLFTDKNNTIGIPMP
jgi:hypothetical protein